MINIKYWWGTLNSDEKFCFTMVALAAIFGCGCSLAFDYLDTKPFGQIIIREDYLIKDFIFWSGGVLMDFFLLIAVSRLLRKVVVGKLLVRWLIDLAVIDEGYLIFSNPYIFNRSKYEAVALTFLLFSLHCLIASFRTHRN